MKVGIGLPSTVPGVEGHQVIEWAQRAEVAGFSSLGTIDRLVYPNYEPFVTLAAVAAVTERIALTTAIAIIPYRGVAAVVAKQAATIHHLSGGRLVLGVAIGARDDDYEAAGIPVKARGRLFDEMLDEMTRLWAGEERGYAGGVGPDVSDNPPPLILGGNVDRSFERAARLGKGWMMGGAPVDQFPAARDKLVAAFRDAGRDDEPRATALTYFSLDDDPETAARNSIGDYYAFGGKYADMMVEGVAKGEDEVKERVRGFAEAGCDELVMFPSSTNPEQVDRLAAAVF